MKRVTGIGGIFFKCKNPSEMKNWYKKHLGLQTDDYGTTFEWRQAEDNEKPGFTQWSPFSEDTKYFKPSEKEFMINYRVENLEQLIAILKEVQNNNTNLSKKSIYNSSHQLWSLMQLFGWIKHFNIKVA